MVTQADLDSGLIGQITANSIRGAQLGADAVQQQKERDAKLAQLIKGSALKQEAITKNQEAANAQAQAQGLKPGTYSTSVSEGGYSFDPRAPRTLAELLTPGQKSADVAFGKEYSDYVAGGGSETANKNLSLLENVEKNLTARGNEAPNLLERGVQYGPDWLRTALTPKIKAEEDAVRTAVQSSLRQTLGPQFTAKEGEELMKRSYDPRLSAAQNLEKLRPEIAAIKAQIQRKMQSAQQFERTGSIRGIGAAGGAGTPASQSQPQTKQVNGKTYVRTPEGWVPQ
jgi:hypothetical protein